MRTLTKPPLAFVTTALAVAKARLPEYSHAFSPRKFTQHQLVAILALKEFLRTDYRCVIQFLAGWPGFR